MHAHGLGARPAGRAADLYRTIAVAHREDASPDFGLGGEEFLARDHAVPVGIDAIERRATIRLPALGEPLGEAGAAVAGHALLGGIGFLARDKPSRSVSSRANISRTCLTTSSRVCARMGMRTVWTWTCGAAGGGNGGAGCAVAGAIATMAAAAAPPSRSLVMSTLPEGGTRVTKRKLYAA
jgi:hypothetical protein